MISPNGIRAVLFDVDGTLRYNQPSSVQTFLDYAVRLGAADSTEGRADAFRWWHYYWAQSEDLLADLETFSDKDEAFWTNYARRHLIAFGCPEDQAQELAPQLHQYMHADYKAEDWVPPDVPQTLETLQTAGFRLAVLSNRTLPCNDYLNTLGLLPYFDFAMVAGEVDCWKPDPEIFRHALRRMNLRPEEVIYVGDNYYADVVGAQRAGIRPVLIDPDHLYPEAGCPVIRSMSELCAILDPEFQKNPAEPEERGS